MLLRCRKCDKPGLIHFERQNTVDLVACGRKGILTEEHRTCKRDGINQVTMAYICSIALACMLRRICTEYPSTPTAQMSIESTKERVCLRLFHICWLVKILIELTDDKMRECFNRCPLYPIYASV